MKKVLLIVMALTLLSVPAYAANYQVVDVKDGGTVKGKVKTGVSVSDPMVPIVISSEEKPEDAQKIRETCGKEQKADMYIVSSANEVKNVIVMVENVTKGAAVQKKKFVIDNKDCRFHPLVGVSYVTSDYVIKNSDPILHNTSLGKIVRAGVRRTVYNLALPFKDQVLEKPNRVSGLIDVKCDAHAWMRAYVYSTDHPYFDITDDKGSFEIKNLPAGKYKVRFWHEGFEDVVKDVEVKAGGVTDVDVTFTKTRKPDFMGRIGM